ncbi:MAG: hypothetical protein SGI73_09425 [Chloroflexota bacterium]|nr:hypothetical protein [Chloroflexota bacterium]
MANNWVKYEASGGSYELVNLDRATRFRHVSAGEESVIEIYIDGQAHTIMKSIDSAAYEAALAVIQETTGYKLE